MTSERNDEKKVSIIVPVYNVEPYLTDCLDSLLEQSYLNLEILLIDDGSTDKSGDICDLYEKKDSRVKVFHKKNGGVSSARNLGIDMSEGEYLVFVDSDDCVHEKLVEIYMDSVRDGEIVLCDTTSDNTMWEEIHWDECLKQTEYFENSQFMQLYCENYINPPFNKCYVAEIIKKNGIRFPEDMNLGEDLIFNLDYLGYTKGRYRVIHYPFYFYREDRSGSLSTGYRDGLFEIQQKLFKAVRKFLENVGAWNEENQKKYYGIYWDRLCLTVQMCKENEGKNAGKYSLQGILHSSVWQEVWDECKARKVVNWKRKLKYLRLKMYRR